MLTELAIEDFAIVDRLLVRLDSGFTVLTGETGAGKSIIIDALQAALGERTGSDVVRSGARFASVEAVFAGDAIHAPPVEAALADNGIDSEDVLILRREIGASGRGSARINGRAVPVSTLAALGGLLVDIHGQSDHLAILRRERQLDVLDAFGGVSALRLALSQALRRYADLRGSLDDALNSRAENERRLDLLRFQVQEIESANLLEDEEDDLATERSLLLSAERRAGLADEAFSGLHDSVLDQLRAVARAARALAEIDDACEGPAARLESAEFEVEDLTTELRSYRDAVEFDQGRLDAIEERLDEIRRLERKYGSTVGAVLSFGREARSELDDIEHVDQRIEDLRRLVEEAEAEAGSLAETLSRERRAAAERLTSAMRQALEGLQLGRTDFRVELDRVESEDGLKLPGDGMKYAYTSTGIDSVSFVVSFNPGEPVRPLERVASGGETSRFLLALKSVLADADQTATLIFDEVDVGVGGRAGGAVGERLRELSDAHQVISITHLPQVAALADEHLVVVKKEVDGRTGVAVERLGWAERIDELAHMMSGTGSESAHRSAAELLQAAQRD